jgi:hypothetical protein
LILQAACYLTKAWQYSIGDGDSKMVFDVGPDRVFEIDGAAKFPLYTIAEVVKRRSWFGRLQRNMLSVFE